jgi:hypothetical protein
MAAIGSEDRNENPNKLICLLLGEWIKYYADSTRQPAKIKLAPKGVLQLPNASDWYLY